jgi:hypothetical protein
MKFEKYLGILLSILFLFPLYLTRSPNYLFFDSLVELFSIVVACYIFTSELTKHLKSLHPKMKILYMSGYTNNSIVHHGVLEKGVNYIQKPFTLDGLARRVREVLDKDAYLAV